MSSKKMAALANDDSSDYESENSDIEISYEPERPKQHVEIAEKDEDEEELERLVLGGKASFREHLFKSLDETGEGSLELLRLDEGALEAETGHEDADDAGLFFYDSTAAPGKDLQIAKAVGAAGEAAKDGDAPAWEDSDDERLSVSLAGVSRLRKLRLTEGEDIVSGTEYTRRLRQQFLRLSPLPAWATEAKKRRTKRRRRSSAASDLSDSDVEGSGDEVDSALPLDKFLRSASALNAGATRKKRKLRPEVIDIQKTRDIPDSHKGPVGTLAFHPQHPVLLSSSTSSIINLHHVAPTAHPTPNPLLTSVQIKQTPIRRSEFLHPDGSQIVFAGRRRFFHSWDLSTGQVRKISKVAGHRLEQKTMERFRTSPCGRYMALIATDRKGGGALNVLAVDTMQWIAQARLDGRGGIADFAWWRTGEGITILGRDGQVGEWSVESRRFLGVWRDEGSVGGTVIALGGHYGPAALGGDKWVAVGSTTGIVNIYDRHDLLATAAAAATATEQEEAQTVKPQPQPRRAFEQLTTPVTVVAFTPDGQLLAFASKHKKDALRLAHLPSCTVYRNWPTEQTPLGRISAVAFGSGSDVLAVGNDSGKIRLWEIRA
ncbi:uncharacterized protein E0L32_000600 [Thyridium curvatum]|uniref:Uncharacterized protein n=1 Tax=Thyridium curvatum TaxID=1093900 RepID=A0A507B536_9PEZI|nr:uncharacterized protein E0L32_000600 [Thyridium curvatum]TPX14206.1 hypothetical protein E0L32_000600 [Thyridium curvatum]